MAHPAKIQIRDASLDDAQALSDLSTQTFKQTFDEHNDPADMDLYLNEAFSVEQLTQEFQEPGSRFLLAFSPGSHEPGSDVPVAYAKLRFGRCEPEISGPDPMEIERLYVDQSGIGKGFGSALMEACLQVARNTGLKTIWLGVWEHNHRALTFYQRWGFEVVGSHPFRLGTDDQIDLLMERPVELPPEKS